MIRRTFLAALAAGALSMVALPILATRKKSDGPDHDVPGDIRWSCLPQAPEHGQELSRVRECRVLATRSSTV